MRRPASSWPPRWAPLAGGDPERYATLLLGLTVMTGLLYLFAGVIKLGFIANFLSQPILTGYLNGIALLIIVGQVPKLFGYTATEEKFLGKILEFFERVDQSHWPTAALGTGMLMVLVLIMRFLPRLPGAFVVVGLSILIVVTLGLDQRGVAVLGDVPGGLPSIVLPSFHHGVFNDIFGAAAGLVLVSFTSGVLTAKSFARRNGYEVNANQELIGFGACNLASGLAQGFPVTGADSRTAVNNAMGGKTQMVGLVAGGVMLLVLLFLTAPLAYVPDSRPRRGDPGLRRRPVRSGRPALVVPHELPRVPDVSGHHPGRAGARRAAWGPAGGSPVPGLAAVGRVAAQ